MIAREVRKLVDHMFWADNEVWKVILSSKKASSDENIKQLLFHYHMTQKAFCQVWTNQPFVFPKSESFPDIRSVEEFKNKSNKQLIDFFKNIDDLNFDEELSIPWSKYFSQYSDGKEPEPSTLLDSIMQVIMHSTYHRAQVNRRLREIEIEPPIVDYIFWLWAGLPKE